MVDELTIELDDQFGSNTGDNHMVPLSRWVHTVCRWLDQVVNCTGVVKTGCPGIVDGDLNTVEPHIFTRPRCKRMCPDEDTAVTALTDLEVERKHKVSPGLLVNQHIAAAVVRIQSAMLGWRFTGLATAGLPAVQGFTVEEQNPALLLFGGS